MDMKQHTTLVPESVAALLAELSKAHRTWGVTGAVILALEAFQGKMLEAVQDAFPLAEEFEASPKITLRVRLPREMEEEINSAASIVRKMKVVGLILFANRDRLGELITAARTGGQNEALQTAGEAA